MIAKYEKLSENISDEGARARDKGLINGIKVIDIHTKQDIIDCRLYMGRSSSSSTIYCNIWLRRAPYGAASGKAGGYGYDKKSAAVGSALDNLGVKLYHDDGIKPAYIAGVGDDATRLALIAIAVSLGYSEENLIYVECYA